MGRRAKNKQADPLPLAGFGPDRRNKGKKKAVSTASLHDQYKAVKGKGGSSAKDRNGQLGRVKRRGPKVDEIDEGDSELDEALRPG